MGRRGERPERSLALLCSRERLVTIVSNMNVVSCKAQLQAFQSTLGSYTTYLKAVDDALSQLKNRAHSINASWCQDEGDVSDRVLGIEDYIAPGSRRTSVDR